MAPIIAAAAMASLRAGTISGPIIAAWPAVQAAGSLANQCFSMPITREMNYQANWRVSNLVPDIDSALKCFHAGIIDDNQLYDICGYQGMEWSRQPDAKASQVAWWGIVGLARTRPDLGMIADLWRQGWINTQQYTAELSIRGVSDPTDRSYFLSQGQPWDIGRADAWYEQGIINDDQYAATLARAGYSTDAQQAPFDRDRPVLTMDALRNGYWMGTISRARMIESVNLNGFATDIPDMPMQRAFEDINGSMNISVSNRAYEQLSTESPYDQQTALSLFYRGEITQLQLRGHLAAQGMVDPARQDSWQRGQRPIPGPSDLISLAVREAWDNQTAQRFGYDNEFPPEFAYWMQQTGWDWSQDVPDGAGGMRPPLSWSRAYWRAHWSAMSPSQGYEAFHRLRPERINRFRDLIPGITEFTWNDLSTVLKVQDYPDKVRAWLAACSFTVIDIRAVRMAYQFGIRNRAWLIANVRDRGMAPEDAEALADIEDARIRAKTQAPIRAAEVQSLKRMIAETLSAYELGIMTRAAAFQALTNVGMGDAYANNMLDALLANSNAAVVKTALNSLKKGWLSGEFSALELPSQLARIGITTEAIPLYVSRWTILRTFERRQFSTSQILGYLSKGLIAADVAQVRLLNLGWNAPDAMIAIAAAEGTLAKAQAAAIHADQVAQAKRSSQLEAAQKKLQAEAKKIQADLRRVTPITQLHKWYCDRHISAEYVYARMEAMGYAPDVTAQYIADWETAKKCAPAVPKAIPPEPAAPQPIVHVIPPQSETVGTVPNATNTIPTTGGS